MRYAIQTAAGCLLLLGTVVLAQQPGISEPGVAEPGVSEPGIPEPGNSEPDIPEPGIDQPALADFKVYDLHGVATDYEVTLKTQFDDQPRPATLTELLRSTTFPWSMQTGRL